MPDSTILRYLNAQIELYSFEVYIFTEVLADWSIPTHCSYPRKAFEMCLMEVLELKIVRLNFGLDLKG